MQQRGGGTAQITVSVGLAAEAQRAPTEGVADGAVPQPFEPDQLIQDPVGGRPGEPGSSSDILQRESSRGGLERIEDQGHSLHHRRWPVATRGVNVLANGRDGHGFPSARFIGEQN
ncbi:hypothetical protein GCM10027597_59770 [Saccharopolyspora tripterygii]